MGLQRAEIIRLIGCTFWQNIESKEIRAVKPKMKGQAKREQSTTSKYPRGTGSPLYEPREYREGREWMVSMGAKFSENVLPMLVGKSEPTDEEIDRMEQHAAAKNIQKHARRNIRSKEIKKDDSIHLSTSENSEAGDGQDDYTDD
jgi:hypothetical protein